MLWSCASTDKPVLVRTVIERDAVPAALLRPCPKKQRGPLPTTGEIVNRLVYTEGALSTCSAQVDGIRAWNDNRVKGGPK